MKLAKKCIDYCVFYWRGRRSYRNCVTKLYDFHNVEVNASTYFATGWPGGRGLPQGGVFVKLAAKCIDYCVF